MLWVSAPFFCILEENYKKAINNVRAYIIEKENYKIVGAAVAHYCSNQMEGQKMHWSYDTLIARAALCLHIFRCADFILFVCGSAEEQRKKKQILSLLFWLIGIVFVLIIIVRLLICCFSHWSFSSICNAAARVCVCVWASIRTCVYFAWIGWCICWTWFERTCYDLGSSSRFFMSTDRFECISTISIVIALYDLYIRTYLERREPF